MNYESKITQLLLPVNLSKSIVLNQNLPYCLQKVVVRIVYFILQIVFLQRIKKLVRHTEDWGPAVEKHRVRYLQTLQDSQESLDSVVCTPLVDAKAHTASQQS